MFIAMHNVSSDVTKRVTLLSACRPKIVSCWTFLVQNYCFLQ